MTKQEAIELMEKAPEALTSRDVRQLNLLAYMMEAIPGYLDTLDRDIYPVYADITESGSPVTRRIIVGYE